MTLSPGPARPVVIGRSSSHFTRVTRIFAAELEVDCGFQVVRDLMSTNPLDYGNNPALRLPALQTPAGVWFGALNICRELARRSRAGRRVVWPEQLETPLLANAQELTLQAMSTEVALIMAGLGGSAVGPHPQKMRESLTNSLAWLDENVAEVIEGLPAERDVSFLEVTLLCLVTHLEFREVVPIVSYARLAGFRHAFETRPSVAATPFVFD
jgi:hypothetical protein